MILCKILMTIYSPYNTVAKIVSFFYFPIGIVLIGIIISLIRETVLASIEGRVRRKVAEGMEKHEILVHKLDDEVQRDPFNQDLHADLDAESSETYEQTLRNAIRTDSRSEYRAEVNIVPFSDQYRMLSWVLDSAQHDCFRGVLAGENTSLLCSSVVVVEADPSV